MLVATGATFICRYKSLAGNPLPSGPYSGQGQTIWVGGSCTIGGSLNADGQGFTTVTVGPGGVASGQYGPSYGGVGWNNTGGPSVPYGSITNPVSLGSGSVHANGGGALILSVVGALQVVGVISAQGANSTYVGTYTPGSGAGGTVNIFAYSISGPTGSAWGTVSVNGGNCAVSSGQMTGGGGRIAVKLYGSGNTFPASSLAITAYGGHDASPGYAGQGTIYLEKASDGLNNGTLVFDNASMGSPSNGYIKTGGLPVITTWVTGTTVGSMVLQNDGWVIINPNCSVTVTGGGSVNWVAASAPNPGITFNDIVNQNSVHYGIHYVLVNQGTLTVGGNWTNNNSGVSGSYGSFTDTGSGSNSLVFNGTGTQIITGTTTFRNFTATTAGATLQFQAGQTQTVTGTLTLGPSGAPPSNLLYLRSSSTSAWTIAPTSPWTVQNVDVQYSTNTASTAINPTGVWYDEGHNTNWGTSTSAPFVTAQPSSSFLAVGNNASFSVTAIDGTPAMTYQWYHNGTSLGSGATSATYTISPTTSASYGSYYVKVTNTGGTTQTNTVYLDSLTSLPSPSTQASAPAAVTPSRISGIRAARPSVTAGISAARPPRR